VALFGRERGKARRERVGPGLPGFPMSAAVDGKFQNALARRALK
jgi:hypothetical protein